MLGQILDDMHANDDNNSDTEDPIEKRNKEFMMENFFKIYDRPPLSSQGDE